MKRLLNLKGNGWKWVAGGIGVAALYYILLDKSTGVSGIDKILQGVGGGIGIEGAGKGYIPDVIPGNLTPSPSADTGGTDASTGGGDNGSPDINFGQAYIAERITLV